MAGRRQHYIQQHLSQGFAIDPARKTLQLHVFSKSRAPYITAVEKFGAEHDFYSPVDDTVVDDAITDAESNRFNGFLNLLRTEPRGTAVDPREAARYYQHLLFRSKNTREVFAAATGEMVAPMRALSDQRQVVQDFMIKFFAERPERFLPRVEQQFGRKFSDFERTAALELLRTQMPALVPKMMDELWPNFAFLLEAMIARVPKMIAVGHRNALRENFLDESGQRESGLRKLHWRIHDIAGPLVLGDSCVFSELDSGRFMPMPDLTANVSNHYLPLSSSRYLVANASGDEPRLTAAALNVAAAECSYEKFCASIDTPDFRQLASSIGRQVMPLSAIELKQIGAGFVERGLADILARELS